MKHATQASFVSTLAAVALLAGCATTQQQPAAASGKPEDIVRARAQERVDFVLNKNFDKAYPYLLPSYRAQYDVNAWRNKFGTGAQWVNPKVSSVKCPESERCEVEISLGMRVLMGGSGLKTFDTVMRETWLRRDGQWWYYQQP